jgi:hypothetical protein
MLQHITCTHPETALQHQPFYLCSARPYGVTVDKKRGVLIGHPSDMHLQTNQARQHLSA